MKSLQTYGIKNADVRYQDTPEELTRITLEQNMGVISESGALAIRTGRFTGRSPKDRFIVKDDITKDQVWWGDTNIPFSSESFDRLYDRMTSYCEGKTLYVRDAYVCADPKYRTNARVICELPWSAIFVNNMFLRLEKDELVNFNPEWTILCVPSFEAVPSRDGTRAPNFAILNFTKKKIIVGGTGYTGEIKKGMFSALNFMLPVFEDTLPMHCSANIGKDGQTAVFFGLSGTGKTTLSADPERNLIGDDEHGWTKENSVFNFEGGCYAKAIDLSMDKEPDIYNAISKGALLENVILNEDKRVNYSDASITQNTRVSYPIDHIKNIAKPSIGYHPKHIFFLTADAFGVLPPISKLTPGQAAYYFINGYTAKVAGTEEGVKEPEPSFSACFGAPFMPLHPTKYAEMLSKKMITNDTTVWLVNTGWSGGPYGTGERIKLRYTRAMISAALNGDLDDVEFEIQPIFNLSIPTHCPNVPIDILHAERIWNHSTPYDDYALKLAQAFVEHFEEFAGFANKETLAAAPKIN